MGERRTTARNVWKAPELVVLVRNRPEETVLTACKTAEVAPGPANGVAACVSLECTIFCEYGVGS
jgi:hypothetical protein